jgi:hypothetical protein
MAGEQLSVEMGVRPAESPAASPAESPAESVPDFRAHVRVIIRPLVRAHWYSPAHWRFIGFVRDHLTDAVAYGGITSAPMQVSLVEELGYQFSKPTDIADALAEYDLRDRDGKRPWVGVVGRFALLARFHYVDPQIMMRPLQMLLAPDKLAHALGRSLVMDAYDTLHGRDQDEFEVYEGPISRWQALKWGMPQAALLGRPQVTAIRQLNRLITLTWLGDETRPNLTSFAARASTRLISRWQEQYGERAD